MTATATVVLSLLALAGATAAGWTRPLARGTAPRLVAAALVAAGGLQWLLVNPVHDPTIVTILDKHGLTPADLLAVPALGGAARLALAALRVRGGTSPRP